MTRKISFSYAGWIILSLFYLVAYMFEGLPSLLSDDIAKTFKVSTEDFSTLGVFYILSYSIAAIPAGVLMDKKGVRKVTIASTILCSFGLVLITLADEFYLLQIAFSLLGLGVSGAVGLLFKFTEENFAENLRYKLINIGSAFAAIGVMISSIIITAFGSNWRGAIIIFAAMTCSILIGATFFIKDKKDSVTTEDKTIMSIYQQVKPYLSRIILYAFLMSAFYVSEFVIGALYGSDLLRIKFKLTDDTADTISAVFFIGSIIGGLVMPGIAEKVGFKNAIPVMLFIHAAVIVLLLILDSGSSKIIISLVMGSIGVMAGACFICIYEMLNNMDDGVSGTVSTVMDCICMALCALYQFTVGSIIDSNWDGVMNPDGTHLYTAADLISGLSFVPILIGVCCIISGVMVLKDKAYKVKIA